MVFHWSLSDSKFPQVSRTLLSILTNFNSVVVWMVSTRPLISKSSSPFNNPLVIVPRALIIIGINVTFIFHIFFNSLARSRYLSSFLLSFNFTLWLAGTAKSTILQFLFVIASLLKFPGLFSVFCPISDKGRPSRLQLRVWSFQFFGDCSECTTYNWYHCRFHVSKV